MNSIILWLKTGFESMANRLLDKVIIFLVLIIVHFSQDAFAQSTTTVSIPSGTVCPDTLIYAQINVTDALAIDSISLSVRFNPQNLEYQSFRQVNPILNQNGNATVNLENSNTVVFKWGASNGNQVNLENLKLVELIFKTLQGSDSLFFNENVSLYRDTAGSNIPMEYEGQQINMHPQMSILIEELDATCPGECEANIAAYVSGGLRPYSFRWQGNISPLDSVLTGACSGALLIEVSDANRCTIDTIFDVSTLDSSEVTLNTDPDTIYMQNPVITFSFEADASVVDWYWNFGDNSQESRELSPVHLYAGAANPDISGYTARLITTSESGCIQIDSVTLTISELPIFIPNVFTPNEEDQINNYFKVAKMISDSEKVPIDSEYIRMELIVFDRWGRKVYENLNYRNNWDGDNLPEGTYFYRLNTFGYYRNESFKGSVTILR